MFAQIFSILRVVIWHWNVFFLFNWNPKWHPLAIIPLCQRQATLWFSIKTGCWRPGWSAPLTQSSMINLKTFKRLSRPNCSIIRYWNTFQFLKALISLLGSSFISSTFEMSKSWFLPDKILDYSSETSDYFDLSGLNLQFTSQYWRPSLCTCCARTFKYDHWWMGWVVGDNVSF